MFHSLQSPLRLDLRNQFNTLFEEARRKDSVLTPHPIMRVPLDIVREIFEAAARADPDTPFHLLETCMAWRTFVLETPSIWKNIHIAVDNDDALKALPAFLLFSKTWKLDVTIIGTHAPESVVDELAQAAHRIHALDICLHKAAREPFRGLSSAPPDGLCSLSCLAVETHSEPQIRGAKPQTTQALERIEQDQNSLDGTDMNLLQTLPMLTSLTALVLHDMGIVDVPPLELLSLKSLRIVLRNSAAVLQSLKCESLQSLDVILEDTSRDGWWDFLLASLVYPQLVELSVDATLDREEDDWSTPWDFQSRTRLHTRDTISTLTIALAFSDWQYIWGLGGKAEYLCGYLLDESIACFPYLSNLHILHVPFLHSPFIWPIEQILLTLRKLELNVPAVVYDKPSPVIELPNLSELRYYGFVSLQTTRLPSLRTPCLQYLEIMHHQRDVHPIHGQINRYWPGELRKSISGPEFSTSKNNSVKDFPEDIEDADPLLPIIHQSFALQELRLYLGDPLRRANINFGSTTFPVLKRLYCSIFYLPRIVAPQLEELHLLWSAKDETRRFDGYPKGDKAQRVLNQLKMLDIYSHANREFHEVPFKRISVEQWFPYLTSLCMIIFPRGWMCIDHFIDVLSRDPHICPALTTITSPTYPTSWVSLCHCLETRNHLSMRDPSVQAIHTLRFPLAVHQNIHGPLQDALSGEFAAPFVPIPLQPWTLRELQPQIPGSTAHEPPLETACFDCYQSGNTFECERPPIGVRSLDCPRHLGPLSSPGVAITAHRRDISGYLA